MKFELRMLIFLTLIVLQGYGQVVKKCDSKVLLETSKRVGTLNQKEITDFLLTLGHQCRDSIEFSEWSNELLFNILDKQTELALTTLDKKQGEMETKTILGILSSPIADNVNILSLIDKIEKVTFNDILKTHIVANLTLANNKD